MTLMVYTLRRYVSAGVCKSSAKVKSACKGMIYQVAKDLSCTTQHTPSFRNVYPQPKTTNKNRLQRLPT